MRQLLKYVLLGWWFFVCNAAGDPLWKLGEYTTQANCEAQRTAYGQAVTGRPTLPCFLEQVVQH